MNCTDNTPVWATSEGLFDNVSIILSLILSRFVVVGGEDDLVTVYSLQVPQKPRQMFTVVWILVNAEYVVKQV